MPQFIDPRGSLVAFEELKPLPFVPRRAFVIADVPPETHRAQHRVSCDEFLWMATGACRAVVRAGAESGRDDQQFRLMARGPGLYLPRGVWVDLFEFDPGSILLCLAAGDYVVRE